MKYSYQTVTLIQAFSSLALNHRGTIGTVVLTLIVWWIYHRAMRLWQRRCDCGNIFIERFHRMRQIAGRRYQSFTFCECNRCKKFWISEAKDKKFLLIDEMWRKYVHPQEFRWDERLFQRGCVEEPQSRPSLFIAQLRRLDQQYQHARFQG